MNDLEKQSYFEKLNKYYIDFGYCYGVDYFSKLDRSYWLDNQLEFLEMMKFGYDVDDVEEWVHVINVIGYKMSFEEFLNREFGEGCVFDASVEELTEVYL